jgi:hypothetical protein
MHAVPHVAMASRSRRVLDVLEFLAETRDASPSGR